MSGEPTSIGTQRRLQALMSRSWSLNAIASAERLRAPQLARALENPRTITPKLAVQVRRAYNRLWSAEPPRMTQEQCELADGAAAAARLRGWVPPLAWDDEQIDKPDAQPVPDWRRSNRVTLRSADLAEDAYFVRSVGGYSAADVGTIAARLGVGRSRLEKAISRQRSAGGRGHEMEAD
jgi:hypothetical protein